MVSDHGVTVWVGDLLVFQATRPTLLARILGLLVADVANTITGTVVWVLSPVAACVRWTRNQTHHTPGSTLEARDV